MKRAAASAITFYQRALSPRKGYACAYRRRYGGDSCSEAVKRVVLADGVRAGLRALPAQLAACRRAARALPRADIDCGVGGCTTPEGCGLFGGGGADAVCTVPGCGPRINARAAAVLLTVLLTVAAVAGYWFYGRQIERVEIQLLSARTEAEDDRLFGLLDGRPPDYALRLQTAAGGVDSNTLNNTSAARWIALKPRDTVYLSDIQRFQIVDREPLRDRVLETVEQPQKSGSGERYRYRFIRRWELF